MTLGLRMSMSLRQTQTIRQAPLQRQYLSLRLELIQALYGDLYTPEGECPNCGNILTPEEILKGFSDDPRDYDTTCTRCEVRFAPSLKHVSEQGSKTLIPFYCGVQSIDVLRQHYMESDPLEILKKNPGAYRSAIFHYGSLKNAFAEIGIDYEYEKIDDWKDKVRPFIGRIPDKVIASYANVSARTVGNYRKEIGIARYKKSSESEGNE